MKLDIQGYFMSLNKEKIYERAVWGAEQQLSNDNFLKGTVTYLWQVILFDDPTQTAKIKGGLNDWNNLPDSKSLFKAPPGQGIAIGNLTSQLISNIFLDQLDRYIFFDLGFKHYGRYVDDFYIFCSDKQKLLQARRQIEQFLKCNMGLTLHPKKQIVQNINKGIRFIGATIYPGRIFPSNRIKNNFNKALHNSKTIINNPETLQSYLGHIKHYKHKKWLCAINKKLNSNPS